MKKTIAPVPIDTKSDRLMSQEAMCYLINSFTLLMMPTGSIP